jgi:hypothetical protein
MRKFLLLFLGLSTGFNLLAQSLSSIKGTVLENGTNAFVENVQVSLQETEFTATTTADGTFELSNVPKGEYVLKLSKAGFENLYLPVSVTDQSIDLGEVQFYPDVNQNLDNSVITLTEEELTDDEAGGADNIAGLLQSSTDAYQQAVAFNFSAVFFQERGYDSSFGQVLFNGIPMNKYNNGRPQWSEWGGLNDMMRNEEFVSGLQPSDKTFGGVLGSSNYITRASQYRKGGQVAYAAANSNYDGRVMATYNTGVLNNGWAFSLSASRRYAQEGYSEGSAYNANAGFIAIEKVIGNHSLNLTAFYTPNRHGKNSPNTQEVFDLGGETYNAYWGWQEGEKRNSRVKEIKEPTFFLSHNWEINEKSTLSTNLMYQYGTIGDSRLGYDTSNNPDPTYYKKLPSYYVTPGYENYQTAVDYTYKFLNDDPDSQILWDDLYQANYTVNGDAAYYLYEDVVDDETMAGSIIFNSQLKDNIKLDASVLYKNTRSENYANMIDLLGAQYQIDADKFESEGSDLGQNDLNNPNRQVVEGDKFLYNYRIDATQLEGFAQMQFSYQFIDFYTSLTMGQTSYQREGLFNNGKYSNNSFGKGEKQDFLTYGFKGGATYKLSGRHLLNINGGYMEKAPTVNASYANSRVSNELVPNLSTTKITTGDISYIYRSPGIKARLTGYYTTFRDLTKVGFYFVEGLNVANSNAEVDEDADFLTTALSGIDYKNYGGEFGIEIQATPTVSFTGAASIGEYLYDSNPEMFLTLTDNSYEDTYINVSQGASYLKNYKQSGTPQRGYSVGMTYRDPKFWWVGANANLLTHSYISLSEFRRTDNFFLDPFDGQPINDLSQEEVDAILAQEKLEDVFVVNLVGGKSWKIKDNYVGFFASVNNLLGESFHSGGFEQARKANYTELQEDQALETPLFGNKYWYGRGTSYYINLYFRF